MDEKTHNLLKKLGLTDGEISVYLALVKLQYSTVGNIIQTAKISSSKVYQILDRLIDKGLATFILEKKTKYFQPTKPFALKELVKKQEEELKKIDNNLDSVIEDINLISLNKEDIESAQIYRGFPGLKTAYAQASKLIEDNGKYYFFSTGYGSDISYLQHFFVSLINKLRDRNISIFGLMGKKEKEIYENYYKKFSYQVKFLPFLWPVDTAIMGDTVLLLIWKEKEPIVYSLKSKILANSYLQFFDIMWKQAKE